ncbi:putative peptidyl-tRNA hydrolase PTRHD1 [Homalodisca vitripennis]|uniref:putative peptidyl-tRNA hydrolase PTRHD1 n=1 Tax=Homalodisca vitripennis TaxID=197043 RepID=UPI001EEB75D0|nr:putative peptidyl-tRNA hydrolase PTRHD1 [Homalodisca vitripennis]
MSVIVQYVLVRSDLIKTLNWPVGAVIAQACHACTAVIHMFYNDSSTQLYLQDLNSMHKIILEVPDEESLKKLSEKLDENAISHKLWIEQPENIATCLAVKPFPKEEVQKYFKNFKLMKSYICIFISPQCSSASCLSTCCILHDINPVFYANVFRKIS